MLNRLVMVPRRESNGKLIIETKDAPEQGRTTVSLLRAHEFMLVRSLTAPTRALARTCASTKLGVRGGHYLASADMGGQTHHLLMAEGRVRW